MIHGKKLKKKDKMKIFTKSRVANFVAGTTILYTIYAVVFQEIQVEYLAILSGLSGFSAKFLWDSSSDHMDK